MNERQQPFDGVRFLVIEDELLQAQDIGQIVTNLGGTVTEIAYGYDQARRAVLSQEFDCVFLDVNLSGTLSFPIADILRKRGIPFIFCTAFGDGVDVYPGIAHVKRLNKPIVVDELRDAVMSELAL